MLIEAWKSHWLQLHTGIGRKCWVAESSKYELNSWASPRTISAPKILCYHLYFPSKCDYYLFLSYLGVLYQTMTLWVTMPSCLIHCVELFHIFSFINSFSYCFQLFYLNHWSSIALHLLSHHLVVLWERDRISRGFEATVLTITVTHTGACGNKAKTPGQIEKGQSQVSYGWDASPK